MRRTMRRAIETLQLRWRERAVPVSAGRTDEAGMTLLEIMIVLALIGLVMGSIGLGLFSRFKSGQAKTAKITVGSIAQAAQQYMMDNNSSCPASIDDLVASKHLQKKPKDPWGKEFILKCPGTSDSDGVDVMSTGPDRQEGTADDIKSWE
jgi:general secretion pathway protein G